MRMSRLSRRFLNLDSSWTLARVTLSAVFGLAGLASLASAATYTATDSAGLTSLLSSTALGDTIILNAGTTYTGTFTLPNKSTGSGYVTLQSSNLASLPAAGTRVNMSHASNMPKIRPGNTASSAIKTAVAAHHFKLIGLEVISYSNPGVVMTNDLIMLGDSAYTNLADVPSDIIIDRCIIRADSATQPIKRGIGLNSKSTDITNCHIAEFKVVGQDAQAIAGWNGPGPYNIINNYLEAACENILFGGAGVGIDNLVPSDIAIKKNYFFKKYEWNARRTAANGFSPPLYAGINWSVKNILEFKNAQRVVVEGNLFENHWVHAQSGWSLVYTPRSNGGADPWTVVQDIQFSKNILRHVSAGPNLMGTDDSGTSQQTKRCYFIDNLFYDIGGVTEFGTDGKFASVLSPTVACADFIFNHNTTFQNGSSWMSGSGAGSAPNTNWIMTNNLMNHNNYGIIAGGFSYGENTLNGFFSNLVWAKNVLKGGSTGPWDAVPNSYSPFNLGFPSSWTGVLVNQASPGANFAGWKVVSGSAYDNTGLKADLTPDGRDIGCDIDAINAATAGCVNGVWPTALIAEDNFNYTGNLNGKNGGVGFGSNAWTAVGGQGDPILATGSMAYTDGTHSLTIAGNKAQPNNTSQSYRNFPATIPTANRTLWISMRMNHTGTGTLPSNHAGIAIFSGAAGGGTSLFLGKPGFGATNWGIDHSGTWVQKSGAVTAADRNALLVYKLVFTSTQVTVSMWVNPILSEAYLNATPDATVTKAHTTGFASIRMSTGTNATGFQFDEWRLGSGFQDVTD